MAPTMNRAASRARAEKCWKQRCMGRTWQEIADTQGFKNHSAARLAVERLLARDDAKHTPDLERHYTSGGLRLLKAELFATLTEARAAGKHEVAIQAARAIADVLDKHAKLWGLHVPVESVVNVHVAQSASAVLERAEAELLALAAAQPAVIDAEVIG